MCNTKDKHIEDHTHTHSHDHNHDHNHKDGIGHDHDHTDGFTGVHNHGHSHQHEHDHIHEDDQLEHQHDNDLEHAHDYSSKDEKTLRVLLAHWINHNKSHEDSFEEWSKKAKMMGKEEVSDYIKKAVDLMKEADNMLLEAKKYM